MTSFVHVAHRFEGWIQVGSSGQRRKWGSEGRKWWMRIDWTRCLSRMAPDRKAWRTSRMGAQACFKHREHLGCFCENWALLFFCSQVLVFHSTSNFTNFPRKSLGSPSQHIQKVVSKVRVTVHHSGHFLLGNLASRCSWLIKESQKPCRTETWPFWSFQNRIVQLNHISLMFNFLRETESNSLDCVVSNLKVSNFRWFAIVFSWDFLLYGFNSTIIKRFSI